MNITPIPGPLLAQVSKWSRLGDGLHGSRGGTDVADLIPLGIGMAVIAIAAAVIVVVKRRNDYSKPCDDPEKLFREVSAAHNLDRGSRRLLGQLAASPHLDQPADIFLQPALFAVEHLPEHLQAAGDRLEELRQRLF